MHWQGNKIMSADLFPLPLGQVIINELQMTNWTSLPVPSLQIIVPLNLTKSSLAYVLGYYTLASFTVSVQVMVIVQNWIHDLGLCPVECANDVLSDQSLKCPAVLLFWSNAMLHNSWWRGADPEWSTNQFLVSVIWCTAVKIVMILPCTSEVCTGKHS